MLSQRPGKAALSPSSSNLMSPTYQERWVNVTWMPHTSLSPSSHVCITIQSAHITLSNPLDQIAYNNNSSHQQDWKVSARVFGAANTELVPLTVHTPASTLQARQPVEEKVTVTELRPIVGKATHSCIWDYTLQLPIRWREIPRDCFLLIDIVKSDRQDEVIYSTAMPFFNEFGKLETGLRRLELHKQLLPAQRNLGLHPIKPPNLVSDTWEERDPVWKASLVLDKVYRLEHQPAMKHFGDTPRVPWLDDMEKDRAIECLQVAMREDPSMTVLEDEPPSLIVEVPAFDIPILHEETFYPIPTNGASGGVAPLDLELSRQQLPAKRAQNPGVFDPLELVSFVDYEDEHDNPVEDKYRALAHDLLRGLVDPAIKPDREQRQKLAAIIDSPSHHPTREEKDLLWRFRFSLVDNRKALTKFLLAVDWTVEGEVVQAAELLEQWRKRSPIEVTDALKLLDKHVAFQTNLVRSYAIDTLAAAPDSELRLYLLQLVQALKYENVETTDGTLPRVHAFSTSSLSVPSLAIFLVGRAAKNVELASQLYWYLKVELDSPTHGAKYRNIFNLLKSRLSKTSFDASSIIATSPNDAPKAFKNIVDSVSKLGTSLRGSEMQQGHDKIQANNATTQTMWDLLIAQDTFVSGIMEIQLRCRDSRGKKDAKEAQLQSLLSKEKYDQSPTRQPIPLPSSPNIFVNGAVPDTAKMFKSALYPALIEFNVEGILVNNNNTNAHNDVSSPSAPNTRKELSLSPQYDKMTSYKVIVKTGDDLRQDQLIIMMTQLMDGLLKRAALDLCLTPYSVIAMSTTSGLVEFIDGAYPISQVLGQYNNSILGFFRKNSPRQGAKYDIVPDVLSTYIRSCAGYCVVTYLLGIGDRHLDNIMLRASGHFFHIDFGFAFGRDPKPLPPAFRLTREMVDGMGGIDSGEYRQFCSLACQAFTALRKSAGLILNLLHLMSDAGIEDLSNNPSAGAEGVIAKVEERFRLDLTDDQAERYFVALISESLSAIAPRVMDVFHSFSVARR